MSTYLKLTVQNAATEEDVLSAYGNVNEIRAAWKASGLTDFDGELILSLAEHEAPSEGAFIKTLTYGTVSADVAHMAVQRKLAAVRRADKSAETEAAETETAETEGSENA